jgi:hypothetical protein
MIVCLSIRRIHSTADVRKFQDQVYDDFQNEVYEDSDLFFQSNEASVLEHIAHIYFSIYFVELELHDRKICSTHLC